MISDSAHETLKHIRRVQQLLNEVARQIVERGRVHDLSKLSEPEESAFEAVTCKLRGLTYGSDEYKAALKELGPSLAHHYQHNTHHPEHWGGGIGDMSLLDLVEMLCDWKAATERHADGSLERSLEHNRGRFGYGEELGRILKNTADRLWPGHLEPWHCFGCGNGGARYQFCEMCGAGKDDYKAR